MLNNQIEWGISELMNLKLLCNNTPVSMGIILSFVDILISNANTRTGIPEETIREYNEEFYDYLDNYFYTNRLLDLSDNSEEFKKMCLLFKVPIIKNNLRSEEKMNLNGPMKNLTENKEGKATTTHLDCLALFNTLSAEEKIKFVMEFQNVEIKLSPSEILVFKSC